ncbi:putative RNA-directed DNA polymerase from transposon X-element [Trichonephila clavipes]|nr:putative RNA-directed DNA polymerase from transposon X-element [Trichonephila clavipes]
MGKDTKINQAKSLSTANEQQKPRSAMSMLSYQILSLTVKELWRLENIGIRDPVENLKGKKLNSEYIKRFEPSLNYVLHKGPSLIELIPDILDRFRSYPIGLSAGIEKAFLQLAIAPEHREFLRLFYPFEDCRKIVYRHCRVVFGACSSPPLLVASLKKLLEHSSLEYRDTLRCSVVNEIPQNKGNTTKRTILSFVQQFYDPIGILSAATLLPKIWLQEAWKIKLAWDDSLPPEMYNRFSRWLLEMACLSKIEIPRYVNVSGKSELQDFVDASKNRLCGLYFC